MMQNVCHIIIPNFVDRADPPPFPSSINPRVIAYFLFHKSSFMSYVIYVIYSLSLKNYLKQAFHLKQAFY